MAYGSGVGAGLFTVLFFLRSCLPSPPREDATRPGGGWDRDRPELGTCL